MIKDVACISWQDSVSHIRVYESDGKTVTEKCWDGSGSWVTGQFSAPGESATATSWIDKTGLHIRVYVSCGGEIIEHRSDGDGWFAGHSIGKGVKAAVTSYISEDNKTLYINVYAQQADGGIAEYSYASDRRSWEKGGYPSYAVA